MIRLIPNTGVQYVPLEKIPLDQLLKHQFSARRGPRFGAIVPAEQGPSGGEWIELDAAQADQPPARFTQLHADMKLLERLVSGSGSDGLWIPIPFEGGNLWVAAWLRKDGSDMRSIEVVLGIDTALAPGSELVPNGNPDGPGIDELGERAPSPCLLRFWRHRAVERRFRMLAEQLIESGISQAQPDDALRQVQGAVAGLADYLARHGAARGISRDPRRGLRLVMEPAPNANSDIMVDLVLDLGNSNTCALLKERLEGGLERRLELVYPDTPDRSEAAPFSTQSAFFEHEVLPHQLGDTISFRFLSMLKLGEGAKDALARRMRDPRPLGLSTPKRYLWDFYDKVSWNWRYANRLDEQQQSPTLHGDLLRRMDPDRPFANPVAPELAMPNHPRVACMVWVLVELLEQAFRQVNSMGWRRPELNPPHCDQRRVLGNLVITYPAGLHSLELENFRRAATCAAKLWSEFRSAPDEFCAGNPSVPVDRTRGTPAPKVQMVCDEGMSIQLCWLYGEAIHRFGSDAKRLVEALGRARGKRQTLRLASIDIGGGTIDLSIADYRHDRHLPTSAAFRCERLFHDSISRAGDDIVHGLLEEHVFPAIIKQVGCTRSDWNRIFHAPAAPDEVRELRRQMVHSTWLRVARRILEGLDGSPDGVVRLRLGDVTDSPGHVVRLGELLGSPVPLKMRIGDVVIQVDRSQMRSTVRRTIGSTLEQCADVIDQFGCDLLIVGGRPSGNAEVREQIYAAMAVPPGQVVFLSELAVDDWYPFADGSGRIGNAKTCGVVGGARAFEARYGIGPLQVTFLEHGVEDVVDDDGDSNGWQPRREIRRGIEPTPIIGWLNGPPTGLARVFDEEQVIQFGGGSGTVPFSARNPLVIASRRVDDPDAEARPIYRVRLDPKTHRALLRDITLQSNIGVRLGLEKVEEPQPLRPGDPITFPLANDRVKLASVHGEIVMPSREGPGRTEDAARHVQLKPCSLPDPEGYWIDTGMFWLPPDEGGAA